MSEKKIKKNKKRSNGHMTVARGMGGEGSAVCKLCSQWSYDRWALGEGGEGQWQGGRGGKEGGGGGGERRKGRGGGGWGVGPAGGERGEEGARQGAWQGARRARPA